MAEAKKTTAPEKDINQIVRHLTYMFNTVTSGLDRAQRVLVQGMMVPNDAYRYQTEFAYRLNEIMVGPRSVVQKNIAECNEYIDQILVELNSKSK